MTDATDHAGADEAGPGDDGLETAPDALEDAAALRKLVTAGALADAIVLTGHSQGGGAALSAQALSGPYGAAGDIVAVVPFAPGWPPEADFSGLRFPGLPTSLGGGLPAAVAALHMYAWQANHVGETHAGDAFPAAIRDALVAALEGQCILTLITAIPSIASTFGELLEETLRASVVSCADGGACEEPGRGYFEWANANVLTATAGGGRVLLVAGGRDTAVTPGEVACIDDKLRAEGVETQVCVDSAAEHMDVVERNVPFALSWVDALLAGRPLPACDASGLPACR